MGPGIEAYRGLIRQLRRDESALEAEVVRLTAIMERVASHYNDDEDIVECFNDIMFAVGADKDD